MKNYCLANNFNKSRKDVEFLNSKVVSIYVLNILISEQKIVYKGFRINSKILNQDYENIGNFKEYWKKLQYDTI